MAEGQSMTTADVVAKVMAGERGDFVREAVALIVHELMEAEISAEVGAELGEVSAERVTHRNGYRPRPWETRVGQIELLIPRKRTGPAYFPSFLEPRRRSEQAIVAVVLEAYVNGVSTRKVDRLVEQLGIAGMTKDRVSALCRSLDEHVAAFRERPLEGSYPYLWLDAKHVRGDLLPARLSQRSERRQRARSRTALAGAVRRRLMGAGRTQVDGLGHSGGPRDRHQQRQQRHSKSSRRDAHQDPGRSDAVEPGPVLRPSHLPVHPGVRAASCELRRQAMLEANGQPLPLRVAHRRPDVVGAPHQGQLVAVVLFRLSRRLSEGRADGPEWTMLSSPGRRRPDACSRRAMQQSRGRPASVLPLVPCASLAPSPSALAFLGEQTCP